MPLRRLGVTAEIVRLGAPARGAGQGAELAASLARRWPDGLSPGGHLVLVHHRPAVAEHVLDWDDLHAIATDLLGAGSCTSSTSSPASTCSHGGALV